MKSFLITIGIAILALSLSCVKLGEDVDDSGCLAEINAANITFAGEISNIMSQNCSNCHGSAPANGASTSYVTLNDVQTNFTAVSNRMNLSPGASGIMPPSGKLDSCTLARLARWQELGFP